MAVLCGGRLRRRACSDAEPTKESRRDSARAGEVSGQCDPLNRGRRTTE